MPLDVTLPSDREIRVVRAFAAPRQLVWDCHTRPELAQRWLLGPAGWAMPVCVIDLRVGGRYRYVWRNAESGMQFGSHGRHLEITPIERLVTSEEMDGLDGQPLNIDSPEEGPSPAINTLLFSESDGRTILTLTMLYPSKDIRDQALQSGMTGGMEQSYARIDAMAEAAA
ncbi:MAG: hypothetical protein JWM33_3401 [Caulobacteraceae bacterium]|nr:hypothetical protein [Caulobacteraceae bacterium]